MKSATFMYEDLYVYGSGEEDPCEINVEVDVLAPTYKVEEVRLIIAGENPVKLTETQFTKLFPQGEDIIVNAMEWTAQMIA